METGHSALLRDPHDIISRSMVLAQSAKEVSGVVYTRDNAMYTKCAVRSYIAEADCCDFGCTIIPCGRWFEMVKHCISDPLPRLCVTAPLLPYATRFTSGPCVAEPSMRCGRCRFNKLYDCAYGNLTKIFTAGWASENTTHVHTTFALCCGAKREHICPGPPYLHRSCRTCFAHSYSTRTVALISAPSLTSMNRLLQVTEILNIKVLVARIALVNNSVAMTVIDTGMYCKLVDDKSTHQLHVDLELTTSLYIPRQLSHLNHSHERPLSVVSDFRLSSVSAAIFRGQSNVPLSCASLKSRYTFRSLLADVIKLAKSKSVLKTASTGSLTRTFTQLFSSDKLSMARKVSLCERKHDNTFQKYHHFSRTPYRCR